MGAREEAQAAMIISDLVSALLLHGALRETPRRRFLYVWEREALDWLRDWKSRGGNGPMNGWTASFMCGEIAGASDLYACWIERSDLTKAEGRDHDR